MPQPTPYDRITNFQNEQALAPTAPHPAPMFDAEYNAIKITIDEILQNLALIQRDDGQLANDSVGRDQLKDEVLIGFGAPESWEGPGHDYVHGDTVFQDNAFWFCEVSHTSTVFADDYAAGYWSLIANFNDAATVGAKLFVQDGPPVTAVHGQQWWESDTGNLFVFYVDPGGGAGQWVHMNSGAGGTGGTGTAVYPLEDAVVIRDPSSHWNPDYFGNPADGVVHRMNRVFVGASTLGSSDIPMDTPDWPEATLNNMTSLAQLASTSTLGALGVVGNSRSSDYRSWAGSASGGAQGVTGMGVNDDTTGAPIACGVVGIAVHKVGVTGVTLNQFDVNSTGTPVTVTPQGGVTGGSTYAVGVTAGAYSTIATQDCTAGMYVGGGTGTRFLTGIVFFADSLVTSRGAGGGGIALEMGTGQSARWLNASNVNIGEIYANATGLHLDGVLPQAYTPVVTFSGGTGTGSSVVAGTYYRMGKMLFVTVKATIAMTTAPSVVTFSLPAGMSVSAQTQAAAGYNVTANIGLVGLGAASASTFSFMKAADGGSPVTATGQIVVGNATFMLN